MLAAAGQADAPGEVRGLVEDLAHALPGDAPAQGRSGRGTRPARSGGPRLSPIAPDERLRAHGRPPLPNTTPHTLRRTYISIALIANNFDVKWVMSKVGHADSKMTLDVYAQLEQRVGRRHG